jgi:4-hydroxy-3-methylbut-2-enyl diphosphate reductase IspH
MHKKEEVITQNFLPVTPQKLTVSITSGASCPDAVVDAVIEKLVMINS